MILLYFLVFNYVGGGLLDREGEFTRQEALT